MKLARELLLSDKDGDKYFRTLSEEDVNESYIIALRSQRNFLINNPVNIDIDWQQSYIQGIISSKFDTICGLFENLSLIGTAGIQNINRNKIPTVGIFLLDHNTRRKGFGKILVWSSCYIINILFDIKHFSAFTKKDNVASWKTFLSCGFQIADEGKNNYKLTLEVDDLKKPDFIRNVITI